MSAGSQYYTVQGPPGGWTGDILPGGTPQAIPDANSDAFQNRLAQQYLAEGQQLSAQKVAQIGANAQKYQALQQAQASEYGANQQLAGTQAQLGYKQGIFGQVFPLIKGQIGALGQPTSFAAPNPQGYVTNVNQLGGGGRGGSPGADFASARNPLLSQIGNMAANPLQAPDPLAAPTLPTYQLPQFQQAQLLNPSDMPVISRDLLNQQVNAGRAQNQQQAATAIQSAQAGVGGRGLGASSPLAQGLTNQIQAATIGANASSAQAAENNAANLNAQYAQAMNQALISQAGSVYGSQVSGTEGAYGANIGALQGMYNAQLGAQQAAYGTQANMYNAGLGALQGMYGQQLGYAGQLGAAGLQANANIYGTNVGYQQAMNVAEIQRQTQSQNAILQALASMANG